MNKDIKDLNTEDWFSNEKINIDEAITNVETEPEEEVVVLDNENEKKNFNINLGEEEIIDNKEESAKKSTSKKIALVLYDAVSIVLSSIIIIAVVFTFVFRLVSVEGDSMTNTLQDNDYLLAAIKTEYEQGDIIVITQDTYFHEPLIKRVIAKGGQTVDINYQTGEVSVDGKVLDEPYVRENYILEKGDYRDFPYTVPEGHLFCMGDNRNGSTDSRSTLVGPIDERAVLGKAIVRVLPFGDFDIYNYE